MRCQDYVSVVVVSMTVASDLLTIWSNRRGQDISNLANNRLGGDSVSLVVRKRAKDVVVELKWKREHSTQSQLHLTGIPRFTAILQ